MWRYWSHSTRPSTASSRRTRKPSQTESQSVGAIGRVQGPLVGSLSANRQRFAWRELPKWSVFRKSRGNGGRRRGKRKITANKSVAQHRGNSVSASEGDQTRTGQQNGFLDENTPIPSARVWAACTWRHIQATLQDFSDPSAVLKRSRPQKHSD
jgi:hypothetical protein